jgi:hypothetical protein
MKGGTYVASSATSTDPATDAAVTTAIVDANDSVVITTTTAGNDQAIGNPTDTTAGKDFTVMNNDTSTDEIVVNEATILPGFSADFIWDGSTWSRHADSAANSVVIQAKVNEVAGITKGQVVHMSGVTGSFPQVSLADNTNFAEADVIAIANETASDGQTIGVIIAGEIRGVNTSTFTADDILYLGTAGALTNIHPTGINAVQRVGRAIKINASTGSFLVELDPLTDINDHDGIMRRQIVNQNAGTSASAAYTIVNDASHRASLSMVGSNYNVVAGIAESMVIYNEGYNKTVNAVDGNFGFEWWTDVTDSHNLSSTSKMNLSAAGELHTLQQLISHTADSADDHALEIDCNAAGFGDVKAIDITYITGAIAAGQDEECLLVNIDQSASTGGTVLSYEVLSTSTGSASVYGLAAGATVNPLIQEAGTFGDMDYARFTTSGGGEVDCLTDFTTPGAGTTMFTADNDYIIIGDVAQFSEIEFILSTAASQNINPTIQYSTGGAGFTTFTPTDGTNGFRNTGIIAWLPADISGSWATNTSGNYEIKIIRTRNGLTTSPIEDLVQISSTTEYSWDKDGVVSVSSLKTNTIDTFSGTDTTVNQNLIVTGDVGIGLTPTANMDGLSVEAGLLTLKETTTPTADTGYFKIYSKSDNKAYCQTGDGIEHEFAFV